MSEFNFKSQICTSREQSERLLVLGLKKETADCNLTNYSLKGKGYQDDWQVGTTPYSDCLESWRAFAKDSCWELIPAWSLHRLIEMTPQTIGDEYEYFALYHTSIRYGGIMHEFEHYCSLYDNIIDCIEWLIKEGYFNKEYLV